MTRVAAFSLAILVLLTGFFPRPAVPAPAGAGPLVIVGPDTLTTGELDLEISANIAESKGRSLPDISPDDVLKRLVEDRLLEQEGYRIKADQSSGVQNQVREYIRAKSVRALLDSISAPRGRVKPPDPDSLLSQAGKMRRYSHILVKDQKLAAALRDSLSRGVPFADLARRHSIDGNAAQGGDLGWAPEGAYLEPFEAAASKLRLNEIAGPVQTTFGWHLIMLTGVKADTLKSKEMAKALADTRERDRIRAAVDKHLDSLRTAYHVTVNDSLLHSLDYKTDSAAVQKNLETSQAVLAVLPTGNLTVRGLTRNIHFQYFHGVVGRADADQIRDHMFQDWMAEGLLTYEARQRGLDRDPGLLAKAKMEERRLVREQVLETVLGPDLKPSQTDIRAYYDAHKKDFIPSPRVKVRSVLVTRTETAKRFRDEIDKGASLAWLATTAAADVDSVSPIPGDWMDPADLGLKDSALVRGTGLGPIQVPGGWAVAQITDVDRPGPAALADCQDDVVEAMKKTHYRDEIKDAISQLQAATRVEILPGARDTVASRIQRIRASQRGGGHQ